MTKRDQFRNLLKSANKLDSKKWDTDILRIESETKSLLLPLTEIDSWFDSVLTGVNELKVIKSNYHSCRSHLIGDLEDVINYQHPVLDEDFPIKDSPPIQI